MPSAIAKEIDFAHVRLFVADGGYYYVVFAVVQEGAHAVSAQDKFRLQPLGKQSLDLFKEDFVADFHRSSV